MKSEQDSPRLFSFSDRLQTPEELMLSMLESIGDGFLLINAELQFVYLNKNAEAILGLSREEAVGRLIWDVFPEALGTSLEQDVRCACGGKVRDFEILYEPWGRWFHNRFFPLKGGGLCVHFQDITARKTTEESLRKSEERFDLAVKAAREGVWDWNVETGEVWYSPRYKEMLGYREDEIEHHADAWLRLLHPEDREPSLQIVDAALKGERDYEIEFRLRHKEGHYLRILSRGYPVRRPSDGKIIRIVGTHLDVSDLRKAQSSLTEIQKENERLADFIRNSSQPFGLGKPDGSLSLCNEAFEQLVGYSKEELEQVDWNKDLTPPEWRELEKNKLAELHRTGQPVRYEKEYIRKDGRRVPVELLVHLASGPDGMPAFYYCYLNDRTDHHRQLQALREVQNILNEGQRIAHLGSFEYQVETGQPVWSEEQYRIFGLDPQGPAPSYEEILQKYLPGDEKEPVSRAFQETIRNLSHFECEHRILRPDGSIRWVHDRCFPKLDSTGKLTSYIGTTLDITEKKQAELDLRLSEERLRLAIDAARIGTYHWDMVSNRILWSDSYRRIWGVPPEMESCYENWLATLHPEDREPTVADLNRAMEQRRDYQVEYRILWPDGSVHWISALGRFFFREDGLPLRMEGAVFDISDRKQAEKEIRSLNVDLERMVAERTAELRISEERYRMIYDNAGDSIFILSPEGRILAANRQACLHYGYSEEEFLKRTLADINTPGNAALIPERIASVLRDGRAAIKVDHLDSRGQVMHVEAKAAAIHYSGQTCIVSVVHDITERIKHEQEMEEARRAAEAANVAKSVFLANMSHEIRTPLNGIMGMARLLENTALTPDQKECLQVLQTSSHNLLSLINDILDLAKIESGRMELESCDFSLKAGITEVVQNLRPQLHAKELRMIMDIAAEVPDTLVGDPLRLKQILLNLLGNAVKFTHRGEIRISAAVQNRSGSRVWLRIGVADSGIGIPPDLLENIFLPFSQADSSTTRRYGGTGLGLSICRRTAELMGGQIRVESKPGAGSTFTLEVPFALRERTAERGEPKRAVPVPFPRPGMPMRILVVDDHEINRQVAARMLRMAGHTVVESPSGEDALQKWGETGAELILMDIQMPGMDGIETLRRIRQAEKEGRQRVPVLALTARAMPAERDMILGEGFDGYLSKPVDMNILLEQIGRWQPAGVPLPGEGTDPPGREAPQEKQAVDREQLAPLLAEIEDLLSRNRLSVIEKLAGLQQMLPVSESVQAMRERIKKYDFKGARKHLAQVYTDLDIRQRED